MDQRFLLIEKKDKICTITINRPDKRNALTPMLLVEMVYVLNTLNQENEVRCVVIRGSGERAFSSGYDIAELPIGENQGMPEVTRAENPLDRCMEAINDFPYPVIAMINGHAYGAGCEMAATCDIRIAAHDARFSIPASKIGIVYRWRGVLRLIDVIGYAYAKEMFLTGRSYNAEQAKDMGLVNYVVPREHLHTFVYEMAQEISENAPLSLKALKKFFNRLQQGRMLSQQDILEIENLRYEAFKSEDIKEGRSAFREKRKPVFKGR